MITTKSRYALRAVLDIARYQEESTVRRSDIARRQGIQRHYLERILLTLRDGGILISRRGPGGGFRLRRSPYTFTVWDIIDAMGEGQPPLECLVVRKPDCTRIDICDARGIWARLYNVVRYEMQSIRLSEIIEGEKGRKFQKEVESILSEAEPVPLQGLHSSIVNRH